MDAANSAANAEIPHSVVCGRVTGTRRHVVLEILSSYLTHIPRHRPPRSPVSHLANARALGTIVCEESIRNIGMFEAEATQAPAVPLNLL